MTWREKVVKEAKTWLGTPYHSMARVKGAGVDCGQLLLAVYEQAGCIPSVDVGVYSPEWHLHRGEEKYLGWVAKYCDPVEEMRPGDVLVFQFGRCISHGGIYIGDGLMIHAHVDHGVIVSRPIDSLLLDKKGRSRLRGIWRWKGANKWVVS